MKKRPCARNFGSCISEQPWLRRDYGLDKQNVLIFSYPSVLTYVLGVLKNRLNETVLLSTNSICFGFFLSFS